VVNRLIEALTSKETQILRLIAAGYANHEIAGALHNSDGTMRNAVSTILAKLDVRDRTRAVITAMEHGLI
jgi:DNA-binding NarL/FixJ family response regulator